MDLIRRLRYSGYLDQVGITEHDPGEIFEKLIDHLASTSDWSRVSIGSGGHRQPVSTASGSDRAIGSKKKTKKVSKKSTKSRKSKTTAPAQPDEVIVEL